MITASVLKNDSPEYIANLLPSLFQIQSPILTVGEVIWTGLGNDSFGRVVTTKDGDYFLMTADYIGDENDARDMIEIEAKRGYVVEGFIQAINGPSTYRGDADDSLYLAKLKTSGKS